MKNEQKICLKCGRQISWRKKWERCWDEVKYCSKRCKSSKVTPHDITLEATIFSLLTTSRQKASHIFSHGSLQSYQKEEMRMAVRRLEAKGKVEIFQGGSEKSSSYIKGDFLIKLCMRA